MANENKNVTDKGIEGRATPTDTIRGNSQAQGKKSAGNVGATNVSHK